MARIAQLTARFAFGVVTPALLLAACGSGEKGAKEGAVATDAEVANALGDQIMVDPDLAGQNQANSAVSTALVDGALPPEMLSPEAIQRARAEALKLVGGSGAMKKAPAATPASGNQAPEAAIAAISRAASAPGGNTNCAERADYTMQWAAKLPAPFPVYPQGAVQEAAGTDEGGCSLRVVNYVTAVPLSDVIDFYYTRATAAGFSTQRARDDGHDVLGGVKGRVSYVVYVRALPKGGTEVDLITNGG